MDIIGIKLLVFIIFIEINEYHSLSRFLPFLRLPNFVVPTLL